MHPNEIVLVRLGSSGVIVPSPAFDSVIGEAKRLGAEYHIAAMAQVRRQSMLVAGAEIES